VLRVLVHLQTPGVQLLVRSPLSRLPLGFPIRDEPDREREDPEDRHEAQEAEEQVEREQAVPEAVHADVEIPGRLPLPANGARWRAELLVVADRARVDDITARGPLAAS